jgi:hypothetical protein
MKNENNVFIPVKDLVYHDTVFEYEDREDAEHDRIEMLKETTDKYIRIVEV